MSLTEFYLMDSMHAQHSTAQHSMHDNKMHLAMCPLSITASRAWQPALGEGGRCAGLGRKSVACIMLLCLGKKEFPVDVNVGRIAARLGWIPLDAEQALEVCAWQQDGLSASRSARF